MRERPNKPDPSKLVPGLDAAVDEVCVPTLPLIVSALPALVPQATRPAGFPRTGQ